MTNPPSPRPEPTTGTNYDSYLVPRSKTPEKNTLYETLLNLGWRFDSNRMLWHTPESDRLQGFGALEYTNDLLWASVQPPSIDAGRPDRLPVRPEPLIRLHRTESGWDVWSS